MSEFDINSLIKEGTLEVKNAEHSDERDTRLRIKEADAKHARLRENFKFGGLSLVVIGFVLGSAYLAVTSIDATIKQWCLATLTMIVSG